MRATPSPARGGARVIHVIQGQYGLSERPDDVLSTVLGSCVATCLCDPELGIGGMNHFLLPGETGARSGSMKYGVHAMELLINALLRRGARRERLRARVYGGANMMANLPPIGSANAEFALWFLRNEGIRCVGQCLGGRQARRLHYWPHQDLAKVRLIDRGAVEDAATPVSAGAVPIDPSAGETTLF